MLVLSVEATISAVGDYAIEAEWKRRGPPAPSQWANVTHVETVWAVEVSAIFVGLAIASVLVWRGGRKPLEGHCKKCGYNLTGNVSGVCPECGTAISS
jgi:hypothetical protein